MSHENTHGKKYGNQDFPGGPVVKHLPATAGETGSISGLGRLYMLQGTQAHLPQLLSAHSRALSFAFLAHAPKPVLYNKKTHSNGKPVHPN